MVAADSLGDVGLAPLTTDLGSAPTRDELMLESLPFKLQQKFKSYKQLWKVKMANQKRENILVKDIGELVLQAMHSRFKKKPENPSELLHYKNERTQFLKCSLWAENNTQESDMLKSIKIYLKRKDSYERF